MINDYIKIEAYRTSQRVFASLRIYKKNQKKFDIFIDANSETKENMDTHGRYPFWT